ncbi:uncharacterized protein TRIADDRAFT_37902 [Trichoplax adhaerens]|uniref:ER membrane protein complex subunit 1 n=1 Tax=Trichoplax adhaerens TaxID=10228 RepID=B3S0A1_TRIAD|nr:hypothetical protein TRIADDRAFT_37902 [Trichoplax adhaerens]EDV23975.1 hypothetical protein TRIADDRAFT_37902 [Trichoplax adhaerens]|eukprot:XP_002113501.1 hypothetical protein TRIADDRAFT_37902 [Trichoplax adhaerens]
MFLKKDKTLSYRVLFTYEDHSLALLQQSGKSFWSRDEALAEILVAEMVELALPVSERLQSLYDEVTIAKDGVLSLFFRRISSQLSQLQVLIASFKDFPYNIWSSGNNKKDQKLVRDQFNLRKMIVAVTLSGKLFGIDTASGDIVWKHYLHNLAPFNEYGNPRILLFEQRTTAHYPLPPRCIVLGNAKNDDGKSLIYVFNPLTGKAFKDSETDGVLVDHKIKQAMILTLTDNHFSKILLMVDPNNQVFSRNVCYLLTTKYKSLYLHTVNKDDGQLNGYALSTDARDRIIAKNIWTTRIPIDNQAISLIFAKLPNEPVHSQGRVLGNRSVLYKYANPNLIAITTESKDKDKPIVEIFLVDGVTGAIVFQTYQKNARGPVKLVLCEHWIVFHYWNTKYRRYEMAVIELFEGQKKLNETIFSSFITQLNTVSMQSYVFPFDVITMTVTRTEKAITHKDILIGLPGGEILSLPKVLLDPRRPFVLSASDREEGLIQYVPELPFPTANVINYNQTINGLRKIVTAPAGLESTSLVFAYGLDLFYTRVTPSKMFDVLKEDFDYTFITIVLTAMILVSLVTAQLSSSSNLKKLWK